MTLSYSRLTSTSRPWLPVAIAIGYQVVVWAGSIALHPFLVSPAPLPLRVAVLWLLDILLLPAGLLAFFEPIGALQNWWGVLLVFSVNVLASTLVIGYWLRRRLRARGLDGSGSVASAA